MKLRSLILLTLLTVLLTLPQFLCITLKAPTTPPGFFIRTKPGSDNNYANSAGDVNGDGYNDVVMGDDDHNTCYIIYGGPTASLKNITAKHLTPQQGFSVNVSQDQSLDYLKSADLNNDGYSDLIFGTQTPSDKDKIYVVFGGPSPSNINLTSLTSTQGIVITSQFNGGDIDIDGDINGDGYPDIVYGNIVDHYLYVIYGGKTLNSFHLANMTSSQGIKFKWPQADNGSLGEVSCVGDLNQDGFADIGIINFIFDESGNNPYPLVYVIYGGKNLSSVNETEFTKEKGFIISFSNPVQNDIVNFAGVGDVNKDGYPDIVIGTQQVGLSSAVAYIVYGGSSLPNVTLDQMSSAQGIKITKSPFANNPSNITTGRINPAGDFNGDGYADLVLFVTPDNGYGGGYLVYGGQNLTDFVLDDMNSTQGFEFDYYKPSNTLYEVDLITSAGDVNKDGYGDLVISLTELYIHGFHGFGVLFGGPNS